MLFKEHGKVMKVVFAKESLVACRTFAPSILLWRHTCKTMNLMVHI